MIRRIFRRLLLTFTVSLLMPMLGNAALACTCIGLDVAPETFLREVDLLFQGELLQTRPGEGGSCGRGCMIGTFRVTAPLKGLLGETVDIAYYTSEGTSCQFGFSKGGSEFVAAYRDETGIHYADGCTQYIVAQGQTSEAIRELARENLLRTVALTPPTDVPTDARLLLKRLQWLAMYRSNEEGLAAVEQLLAIDPHSRDGLIYKARFLSAVDRDAEALEVVNQVLASSPSDHDGQRQRVITLIRLGRISEVPSDWRDFDGLEADGVDFSGRSLSRASFRGARLSGVNFRGANLSGATFAGASFDRSDLSAADLSDANFTGATVTATFQQSNLTGADFDQAKGYPDFTSATLTNAVFTSAELRWAKFNGASAMGVNLAGSCVNGDFTGADLTGADFREASSQESKWTGAILRDADLRGATLESNYEGADLTGMRFDDRTYLAQEGKWETRGAVKVANARLGEPNWRPCPY